MTKLMQAFLPTHGFPPGHSAVTLATDDNDRATDALVDLTPIPSDLTSVVRVRGSRFGFRSDATPAGWSGVRHGDFGCLPRGHEVSARKHVASPVVPPPSSGWADEWGRRHRAARLHIGVFGAFPMVL
ncbi:hypothetical protein [Streptomyces sp. NPDC054854]